MKEKNMDRKRGHYIRGIKAGDEGGRHIYLETR